MTLDTLLARPKGRYPPDCLLGALELFWGPIKSRRDSLLTRVVVPSRRKAQKPSLFPTFFSHLQSARLLYRAVYI